MLDPLPAVPSRIEPLGPALARVDPETPTWEGFVQSLCPVRELSPGDSPRDWAENTNDTQATPDSTTDYEPTPRATVTPPATPEAAAAPASLARVDATRSEPLGPERYKVQFTATEEYVRLVEEAKALLSHAVPHATLEDIQLRAMRAATAAMGR